MAHILIVDVSGIDLPISKVNELADVLSSSTINTLIDVFIVRS